MKIKNLTFGEVANGEHYNRIIELIDYSILLKSIQDVEIKFNKELKDENQSIVFKIYQDKNTYDFKLHLNDIKYIGVFTYCYEHREIKLGVLPTITFEVHANEKLWIKFHNQFESDLLKAFNQNRYELMQRLK